jgi:hypothetical protein
VRFADEGSALPAGTALATGADPVLAYWLQRRKTLYFARNDPECPAACIGVLSSSDLKVCAPRTLLDFGSDTFLMTSAVAETLGVPILPGPVRLRGSNGTSNVLGSTPPLTLSYGSHPQELTTTHCFLVVDSNPLFDILLGNADAEAFGAVHDTGERTLTLFPTWASTGKLGATVILAVDPLSP